MRHDNLKREAAEQLMVDNTQHLTLAEVYKHLYRAATEYEGSHFAEGYVRMADDGKFSLYVYEAAKA